MAAQQGRQHRLGTREGFLLRCQTFVTPGAIPWLLVETKGVEPGPSGGGKLTRTTFIQRVDTVGGAAPADQCRSTADLGRTAFVPYESDYVFYRNPTL